MPKEEEPKTDPVPSDDTGDLITSTEDIASDDLEEAVPTNLRLPSNFERILTKKPEFKPNALQPIYDPMKIRPYGLAEDGMKTRGMRHWTPVMARDARGFMSPEELSPYHENPLGHLCRGDLTMAWMPEEHAKLRDAEMAKRALAMRGDNAKQSTERVADAIKQSGVRGITVEGALTEEETVSLPKLKEDYG